MDLSLIILAGGQGTRIRPVIGETPKLLAPITDRPFIAWQMDWISSWKLPLSNIYLAAGIGFNQVKAYMSRSYPAVQLSRESTPLGTYGAVLNTIINTHSQHYIVINGDTIFPICMDMFIDAYLTSEPDEPLLALKTCSDAGRYGSYSQVGDKWIYSPLEHGQAISMGMLLASRALLLSCFKRIAHQKLNFSDLNESTLALLSPLMLDNDFCSNTLVNAFLLPESTQFIDIGTPSSFALAQELIPCIS